MSKGYFYYCDSCSDNECAKLQDTPIDMLECKNCGKHECRECYCYHKHNVACECGGMMYLSPCMSREFDKYSDVCMNCQSFKDCLVASGEDSVYKAQLAVLAFNNARELWKLKTPKNLAMAISCEAGELLECFLWSISGDQVPSIQDLEDEVADIFILLLDFCSKTGIDLTSALEIKLNKNAIKYPI